MSKKNVTFKQQIENNSHGLSSLPQILRLKNLTNQPENLELTTLRERIEELESKVSQLESHMRTKNKRIRRKSCEVEKKHKVVIVLVSASIVKNYMARQFRSICIFELSIGGKEYKGKIRINLKRKIRIISSFRTNNLNDTSPSHIANNYSANEVVFTALINHQYNVHTLRSSRPYSSEYISKSS